MESDSFKSHRRLERPSPLQRGLKEEFTMSLAPAFVLWIVMLGAGFAGSVVPLRRTQGATPGTVLATDEETVRSLTQKYAEAITSGNIESMREFWNPRSSNVSARLGVYGGMFARVRLELIRVSITRLEVTGDKAISQMTTDERQLDKLTGAVLTARDAYHGACRSLEWVKTDSGWRIEREILVQDELAARLEAAASPTERDEILEREAAFVTDSLVGTLVTRGQRHRLRGEFDAALKCELLQLYVAERIGDQGGIAGAFLEQGLTKRRLEDYEQAMLLEQKSLALFEAASQPRGVALALENLAELHSTFGDIREAFDYAQRALKLYEEARSSAGTAAVLSDLSLEYSEQHNFQQALAHSDRAMAIYQKLGDKIHVAMLRRDMADQYAKLGDYGRAREMYQEVLKQTENSGDRGGAAIIRNAISDICAEQGNYSEALDNSRQALSACEGINYKGGMLSSLLRIGQITAAKGAYAEAMPTVKQAVDLARQLQNRNYLWVALAALGDCQVEAGHTPEAREAFAESISILEELRGQAAGGPEGSERYLEGRLQAYRGMFRLLAREGQPWDALALAERTKARVLLDVLQKGRISVQKAMTPDERRQEGSLKSKLNLLNAQMSRLTESRVPDPQRLNELTSKLKAARLDYEGFQASLYSLHPELKTQRGEAPIINASELVNLLPDSTSALLEYVVTDRQSYLFVVTGQNSESQPDVKLYVLPVSGAELGKQTEAFRQELAGRDLGFQASASRLYDLLIKPARSQLHGKTNLIIVPDGKLWELPFQALLSTAHRFVIEDAAISYAPSLTVLREITRRRANRRFNADSATLLAFGNPTPGTERIERAGLGMRNDEIAPLPEAEEEVKAVGRLYSPARSKVYVGAEAREDRVKREAGNANILHFATHGTLNDTSPMYSHLVLARGSGDEDGLLEAWEIMQLDLKADLAVLSACETARGRYSDGEGIIGLSWAMFVAGVPATVVSQWKVEAASTRDLLVGFHRSLNPQAGRRTAKATTAEDLRQAALKLRRSPETSHPFYWAGFVLVGDGR
jgi:CHAT domain-containing protein